MKYFLLFFFVFYCNTLYAQTISGIVKTEKGTLLENVFVKVLNTNISTISNKNGEFEINFLKKGTYKLSFQILGYLQQIQDIEVNETPVKLQIILQPESSVLEEIIVSANKREDRLLNTNLSVTTLSAKKIQEVQIRDFSNLIGLVPNYQYGNLGVGYQQQIAIRGISIFSETPATATYIDGVNALDIAGNGFQLIDVERIEILRGPQGTLYGRNAMGGVINIITKEPDNTQSAFAETSIGNQGLQRYGFGFKTPLVKNKLFMGVSGQFQHLHGFYTNDLSDKTTFFTRDSLKGTYEDGQRMGDEDSYYANLSLKWKVSDDLNFSLNSKIQYDASVGASAYYQAAETDEIAVQQPYKFAVNDLGSNYRKVFNNSISLNYYHNKYHLSTTSAFQHILQAYHHIDQDMWAYDLTTGSSYRNKLGEAYPQSVFSQEIKISSPASNNKLTWTLGSYLFKQLYDKRYATVYKKLGLFFGMQPGVQITQTDQNNSGIAFFGQVGYTFADKWTLTTGLRYDYENRCTDIARYYLDEDGSKDYDINNKLLNSSFKAFSPTVTFGYKITNLQNVYVSYSKGFRAGGNNMFTDATYEFYKPEFSDNYELGYKFRTKNNKLMLNSAFFLLNWKDMQLDMKAEAGIWIVSNVGNVKSIGAELEISYIPFLGTTVDISLGLNDARYGDFVYLDKNIQNNTAIMAPTGTSMIAVQQLFPVSKKIMISARADWRRIGDQFFDLANEIYQPTYHLFNLKLGAYSKKVGFNIWVNNITESKYITFAMPGNFKQTIINRPRTLGATITYKL